MLVKTDTKLVYAVCGRESRQLLSHDAADPPLGLGGSCRLSAHSRVSACLSLPPCHTGSQRKAVQEPEEQKKCTKSRGMAEDREKSELCLQFRVCFCFSVWFCSSARSFALFVSSVVFPFDASDSEEEERMERQATRGAEEISHYLSHSRGLRRSRPVFPFIPFQFEETSL